MSNTFSFTRFRLLLTKEAKEQGKSILLTFTVVFGIIILLYSLNVFNHGLKVSSRRLQELSSLSFRPFLILVLGLAHVSFFSSGSFVKLNNPSQSLHALTLPVSKTEQILVTFLLTTVTSVACFLIAFLLADAFWVNLLRKIYGNLTFVNDEGNEVSLSAIGFKLFLSTIRLRELLKQIYVMVLLSQIFMLGPFYYKKFAFLKTTVVLMLVGAIVQANVHFQQILHPSETSHRLSPELLTDKLWSPAIIFLLFASGFWLLLHYRLKEKEA